jgi:hypothetical protein
MYIYIYCGPCGYDTVQSGGRVPVSWRNTASMLRVEVNKASKVVGYIGIGGKEVSCEWQEYLTRSDLTAMVWKQWDVYILISMHPTKEAGSSPNVSDLYLEVIGLNL